MDMQQEAGRTPTSKITSTKAVCTKSKVRLIPNAAKMVESLRDTGYNPYVAIQDIIDNSIDADATKISIKIESKNVPGEYSSAGKPKKRVNRIIIADNGTGMNEETLLEAVRYGSDTDHDCAVDLGKYGMGLNTAATSMAKKLSVFTRDRSKKLLAAVCDLDDIVAQNEWIYDIEDCSDDSEMCDAFNKHTNGSDTGTVVVLSNIDRVSQDPRTFANTLKSIKFLPRTYRHLLSSGKLKIFVNKTSIKAHDPLFWDHKDTNRWTPGWVSIPGYESLQYRIVNVRDIPEMIGKRLTTYQGLCWIRNEREIGYNKTDPFWNRFPDHRGFIVEIKFSGDELDQAVGVNIQKQLTDNLDQALIDNIKNEILPFHKRNLTFYKAKEREKKKSSIEGGLEEALEGYAGKVKAISKSLHLPPKAPKSTNAAANNKSQAAQKKNGTHSIKQIKTSHIGRKFIINIAHWTSHGPMYDAKLGDNDEILVFINEDHPAMAGGLLGNEVESQRLLFLHFIFACALSELQLSDDYQDAHNKFKDIASSNARELFEKINTI